MIDYLSHIDTETRRIVEIAAGSDLSIRVPTCGAWTLADLTWHVGEVQHFWGWIVGRRASSPADYIEPDRPAGDAGVVEFLDGARETLVTALAGSDSAEPCWSWSSEQTIGFTFRRQAHEAVIHRVDAELATDSRTPIDPTLAADGVDEILTVILGDIPSWGSFEPSDAAMTVTATDPPASWVCRFGRMTGTSPDSGKAYDIDAITVDDTATSRAEIVDGAEALDLWLWNRAEGASPLITGDPALVDRLRNGLLEATR